MHDIEHLLALLVSRPIDHEEVVRALLIPRAQGAHVRRDDDILRIPQRIVGGQGLRVCDVEGRAGQLLCVQRVDQGRLVDQAAARDVDDERLASGQDVEFRAAEEVARRGRERERDDECVETRGEEGVQRFGRCAAVPCPRQRSRRIARVGDHVAVVFARGRSWAGRGCVGVDVGAERAEDAGGCTAQK